MATKSTGKVIPLPQMCREKGCKQRAILKGYCQLHYLKKSYSTLKLMKERNEEPEFSPYSPSDVDEDVPFFKKSN